MGAEVYISTNGINTNSKFLITTGNAIVLVTKNRNKNQNLIIHATNCPKKLIAFVRLRCLMTFSLSTTAAMFVLW